MGELSFVPRVRECEPRLLGWEFEPEVSNTRVLTYNVEMFKIKSSLLGTNGSEEKVYKV